MTELILFLSAFGAVFMLGFQSLNVNGGHYFLAFVTSIQIGVFNLVLYKVAPDVQSTAEVASFLLGGPTGIVCAMFFHRRWVQPRLRRRHEGRSTSEGS